MIAKNILGIDASNISTGGGLTHLVEFLNAAKPPLYGLIKLLFGHLNQHYRALRTIHG